MINFKKPLQKYFESSFLFLVLIIWNLFQILLFVWINWLIFFIFFNLYLFSLAIFRWLTLIVYVMNFSILFEALLI